MNAAYLQAAVPEPFRILGKRLKPFSLGHKILLQRFGSNFAEGSQETPGYADLILSVFICSLTYSQALAALSSCWLMLRLKLWGMFWRRFDVGEKILLFHRYVTEQTNEPEYWVIKPGEETDSGIPWTQFLKVRMRQDFGESESGALDTPYQIALLNFLTHLEGKGIIRVLTEREKDERSRMKAVAESPEFQRAMERAKALHEEATRKARLN